MPRKIPAIVAKTPVPERLPFVKGQRVVYINLGESHWETTIHQVIYVNHGDGRRTRYYSLEGAPGVICGGDRIRHEWEFTPVSEHELVAA